MKLSKYTIIKFKQGRFIFNIDFNDKLLVRKKYHRIFKKTINNLTNLVYSKSTTTILPYKFLSNKNQKKIDDNNKLSKYNISLILEIIRQYIIEQLITLFSNIIKENLQHNADLKLIYRYNKINELVQRWCWYQYNNPTIADAVIPYVYNNKYDYYELINSLNYILKIKLTEESQLMTVLNPQIETFLKDSYEKVCKILLSENISDNNINFSVIVKDSVTTFKIRYNTRILNLLNSLNNTKSNYSNMNFIIKIHIELYNRLIDKLKKFNKDSLNYDLYIFCLLYRYSYIDSGNQQLSIIKDIKVKAKEYGIQFELFGSAINTYNYNYCSLFYDIEKYFGSQGNFFDLNITHGLYWCNPPYDNTIMKKTAQRLVYFMNKHQNLGFIITVPVWDIKTQENASKNNYTNIVQNINLDYPANLFNDYPIYNIIKPYIKNELFIPKNRIPYYNHRLNTYIYAVNTYMLFVYKNLDNEYINNVNSLFNYIIKKDKENYFINR